MIKTKSCRGCINNLGGGHCAINMEAECAEGGGYELRKTKEEQHIEECNSCPFGNNVGDRIVCMSASGTCLKREIH